MILAFYDLRFLRFHSTSSGRQDGAERIELERIIRMPDPRRSERTPSTDRGDGEGSGGAEQLTHGSNVPLCKGNEFRSAQWTSSPFFKKWAYPGLFLIYFPLFKHKLQFLQQINVKICPSSIRSRDSKSRPF